MAASVRPARAEDAAAAVAVVRSSITELCAADHRGDAETLAQWLANKTPPDFITWIENAENFCVVAEIDSRLVGVGLLHRSGEIRLFYLAPAAQRQGIGSAIHRALEDHARSWGLRTLTLHSTALACAFYEHAGYRSTGPARPAFGVVRTFPYEKQLD
jgi:GNAT superfamily N-acetyltransferase